MNALTVTPFEAFRQQVLPPDKATDLFRALPSHIKPEVFERNLLNAIMQSPRLMQFDPRLVYREVCKAASLGLLLDPQLGEAYIVTVYNGKAKREEPQLRVGYKGMCKLARQAGDVTAIYAHEVCKNDHIVCSLGTDKRLDHRPDLFGDRGPVTGYYAVIKFSDGTCDFEPMSVAQAREIRDRSDAWRAFRADKIKSTPWATDEIEMSKKTVLRRLLKRQPQSPELAEAIKLEDAADFPEMRNITPASEAPPMPAEVDKIEAQKAMEIVESGRDDGVPVVWDEDGPPPPDVIEGDGIPGFLNRNGPRAKLLIEIGKLQSEGDLDHYVNNEDFYALRRQLNPEDAREVEIAFFRRSKEIHEAAKK